MKATTVYYLPTGDRQIFDWEAFRAKWVAHFDAVRALATEIGASKFCVGFGGGLVGAEFKGEPHLAFSAKPNKRGQHAVLSRGRSALQKEAIAWMEERNTELQKLVPAPFPVAESHGFISRIDFREIKVPGDESFVSYGSSHIGRGFDPVEPTWFGLDAPVILATEDIDAKIQSHKVSTFDGKRYDVTPDKFETPAGYERLTPARYAFMKAEYELKQEERKSDGAK